MKRLLSLVLMCCILLPLCASAEPIRDQIGAPDTYQNTFQSNSGRTRITVDAAIYVPDASSVNVYEVTGQAIAAENIVALADWFIGQGEWRGDTEYGVPASANMGGMLMGVTEESMEIESLATDENGWAIDSLSACCYRQDGALRGPQILNISSRKNLSFAYNAFMMHDRHGMDARGCRYTREEAIALAWEAAQIIAPELTEISCGVINQGFEPINYENTDEAYLVCFTRRVDGIPVTYSMQECVMLDEDENGDPIIYRMNFPYETLRLVVTDEGVVNGRYESPYEIGTVLQGDVQLLQFERIMNVARQILPLKYVWLEDSYEIRIHIDRIALGYTRLDFKDDMYRYMLTPVWDFFGTYEYYRNGERVNCFPADFNSLLTINAIDGTVIDRGYGY